jgi:DNA ligase D-like protein (predicted ligase)/DNA ligase D-like protein (predicted 3'-phosphoesterase)
MRRYYKPMLGNPAPEPFTSKDWIFEIKWDGIRAISYVNAEISIRSRNGKELKDKFPELEELKRIAGNTVLDGEIIVMQDKRTDFQTLLERGRATSKFETQQMARSFPATYVIFDILEKDGQQLIHLPLIERKNILRDHVKEGRHVVLSVYVEGDGEAYYEEAIKRGVEGIVAKKKESPYEPGVRSHNWLKIKKILSCDCVIFGYTTGKGFRKGTFGALILGLYNDKIPVFVGKVGTGFSESAMRILLEALKDFRTDNETLEGVNIPEEITWVKPELVCEVTYQNLTKDGKLRMPRFHGLRTDKTPAECTIDQVKQDSLKEYTSKRDFTVTTEPRGALKETTGRTFVVQEHHARRLHYDLRLENEGVLKSWAVPKGVPEKAGEKRLAVQTEDHPLEYGEFEGTIPEGQYGAGTVKIWDKGIYEAKVWDKNKIEVFLQGSRLNGRYVLAKFKKAGEKDWILLKARDYRE